MYIFGQKLIVGEWNYCYGTVLLNSNSGLLSKMPVPIIAKLLFTDVTYPAYPGFGYTVVMENTVTCTTRRQFNNYSPCEEFNFIISESYPFLIFETLNKLLRTLEKDLAFLKIIRASWNNYEIELMLQSLDE